MRLLWRPCLQGCRIRNFQDDQLTGDDRSRFLRTAPSSYDHQVPGLLCRQGDRDGTAQYDGLAGFERRNTIRTSHIWRVLSFPLQTIKGCARCHTSAQWTIRGWFAAAWVILLTLSLHT